MRWRAVEQTHDFALIASPRTDSDVTRLAHSLADTVVTPLSGSFMDIETLRGIDPVTLAMTDVSPYAMMVHDARWQRRLPDGRLSDWVVLRERPTPVNSSNRHLMVAKLSRPAAQLGFRMADGICEPVIYRDLLPRGLTALDALDEVMLGAPPGPLHRTAQQEVAGLIERLKLPLDQGRCRQADAHATWVAACAAPLETDDIFAI